MSWVNDNIAAFGGNPDNITVVGVGGGSVIVSALMVSILASVGLL